jgi:hypothetical protein
VLLTGPFGGLTDDVREFLLCLADDGLPLVGGGDPGSPMGFGGVAGGRSPPQLSYPVGSVPANSDLAQEACRWAGRPW